MNFNGNGRGAFRTQVNELFGKRPLLQSFYFKFIDEDHHYGAMEVEADVNPYNSKVALGLMDKDRDDEFSFNVDLLPYIGEIAGGNRVKQSGRGRITFPLDVRPPPRLADAVFVITSFGLAYDDDDHHIDEIGIEEKDGQVTVALNDENDDDLFTVWLSYVYIPRSSFSDLGERSGSARGEATAEIILPVQPGLFVIRGFHFDFNSGDRHVKEIGAGLTRGVQQPDGRWKSDLHVYYGDQTPDDLFTWNVAYGALTEAAVPRHEKKIEAVITGLQNVSAELK
jgi:hypothetical protein